ncbi:Fatty-acid-binding protein 2 [Glycine soja]|uniref:Fatty-acid-binding protein 2 n=1 Tax=Glycine soja TaxID=3848 RepID=A0A445H3Z3_GLYSO|nr:Fatty-acid-binding protein 2 [Glycine soja]
MNNDFLWLPSLYSDPEVFTYLEPFVFRSSSLSSHFLHSLATNSRSFALEEAFGHVSRFSGALLFWLSRASSSNVARSLRGSPPLRFGSVQVKAGSTTNVRVFGFPFGSKWKSSFSSVRLGKISSLAMRMIWREAKRLSLFPVLSLAVALVPPFQNLSSNVLASPLLNPDVQIFGAMDQVPKEVECQGCSFLPCLELSQAKPAVEPKTGATLNEDKIVLFLFSKSKEAYGCIYPTGQLPMGTTYQGAKTLVELSLSYKSSIPHESTFPGEMQEALSDTLCAFIVKDSRTFFRAILIPVLVGTGSRTMTIVKIKSLKVYAFGVYVHPYSLCEKLGPKYASISADELNNHHDFYKDLLREDINMTVRLVANCRGMKINSVKDAFEKSLRARLVKANPSTDFSCLKTFGSYFTENISIPLGTVIEFKRTVDGRLITKISGNQIGSVHSKDLCRAFFDMYIGDVPNGQLDMGSMANWRIPLTYRSSGFLKLISTCFKNHLQALLLKVAKLCRLPKMDSWSPNHSLPPQATASPAAASFAWTPLPFEIMARTRGLGRAIGRVVGRDRPADEDAADVPERRRPIASARRLRVHQMTAEGRDMAEDVADMTDDVSEQPTEAPEMRVDAQGADSGEGSDGDDAAEGFPGGPRDPSVLTSFAEHVAHAVWSGQERPDLKLVSHGRKVTLIGRPVPEIEGLVAATGLSPLIDCSVITGDPGLISAFVERWHSETSTFHLPVGELTITLDDVSSILHLPITGALHSFHALSTEEARFLLTELLEVSEEEARAETALTRGAYVRLGWVRDIYETRCQARRWIVAARAYLLHLVGCTLFANKSATYVHVVHLDAFRDLAHSGGFAWGVAALVHMYDQLDEACRTTTRQLAGYLTLLQCWIYEHFPSVHQCVTDDTYQETSPRASRWLTSKAHMKGITGAPYRARCDGLTVTDVSWLPYTEHRGVRAFQEISSFQGQLRWGPMIVTVRPERVVRQFGYIQSIPPPPVSARLSQDQIDDRWMEFADHLLPAGQPCLVPGQVSADYIEWFFRISHPFMTPTQAADQQRDALAADPEDYIQPPSPQVPVAFDPPPYVDDYEGYEAIAQRLERVLNLRIVTAGTELYDIMQDCLTIARGGPSADGTVRARQRRRTDH